MNEFMPVRNVEHSQLVLDHGLWPDFKEAKIYHLVFRENDTVHANSKRSDLDIEISFELYDLEQPYVVVLQFSHCEAVYMGEPNQQNAQRDLTFTYKARGTDIEGDPLPRGIAVRFEQAFGQTLTFNCLKMKVLERGVKYTEAVAN